MRKILPMWLLSIGLFTSCDQFPYDYFDFTYPVAGDNEGDYRIPSYQVAGDGEEDFQIPSYQNDVFPENVYLDNVYPKPPCRPKNPPAPKCPEIPSSPIDESQPRSEWHYDTGYLLRGFPPARDEITDNAYEMMYPNDTYETARDREINGVIRNRLTAALPNSDRNIIIRTSHGVTTIRGHVENAEEARLMNEETFAVVGVKTVFDRTYIKKPDNVNQTIQSVTGQQPLPVPSAGPGAPLPMPGMSSLLKPPAPR